MDLKPPQHARVDYLNPVQKLANRVEQTLDVIDTATKIVYVNGGSTESEEIGSVGRPFKTISAAVTAAGSDSSIKVIYIFPGTYAEDVTINSANITGLAFVGHTAKYLGLATEITGAFSCTQNNADFARLEVEGITLNTIEIEGSANGNSTFVTDLVFNHCLIKGAITAKSVVTACFVKCKLYSTVLFENVNSGLLEDAPGHNPGSTVTVIFDASKKIPANSYNECYVTCDNTIMGAFAVSRVSTGAAGIQLRRGTRVGYHSGGGRSTSTLGAGCYLLPNGCHIRGDFTHNGTTITPLGMVVSGDVTGSGTIDYSQQDDKQVGNSSNIPNCNTVKDALNYLYSKTG